MTRNQIIQETADFYAVNPAERRSVSENNETCLYKGSNGKECAFQRCVETDLSIYEGEGASIIISTASIIFKPEYKEFEKDEQFWQSLQSFHDNGCNWTSDGLSVAGENQLTHLLNIY